MAAFYPLLGRLFYTSGAIPGDTFNIFFLLFLQRLHVLPEVKQIVYRMPEILFAAEIAFRGLHRCVPQQKLNLLQLIPAVVTQLRTGPTQVMRGDVLQASFLAACSDHVPDNVLREAATPHLSQSGDRSKDFALTDPSGSCPLVESGFDPCGNGHRADVATLANQINHGPVSLAHLDVVQFQTDQFRPAKPTTKQHGQHRVVALGALTVTTSSLEYLRTLHHAQPIARTESELLHSFDTANPGSQLRTEQTGVGGFVSKATHGCELLVYVVGSQMPRFQVQTIAHDYDAVEGQPRLGAIPGDELVNGVLVDSTRSWRAEAVKNGGLAVIQVRQAEHSATVVRLASRFAHGDGLPCRSIELRHTVRGLQGEHKRLGFLVAMA